MSVTTGITAHPAARPSPRDCSTGGNVTRSLLGYLAVAGPFYVLASLAQAVTRSGFSLARDEWSLLALGHLGWMQTANLMLTGAMITAGAAGFRRAARGPAPGGTWAPRLLAGYGIALVGAGLFRADAAAGFPPGTPPGRAAHLTWHGTLHLLSGSVGFACLIAACFAVARMYARSGRRPAAVLPRVVGAVFAAAFAGIASGTGSAAVNLAFTAAVIVSCGWLTVVAVDLYRGTRRAEATGVAR